MSSLVQYIRGLFRRSTPSTVVAFSKNTPTVNLARFAGELSRPLLSACNLTVEIEGDRLLVDGKRLTAPLQHGQRHVTAMGFIQHNDIIGRADVRSMFMSNTDSRHEISYPSLDEYVSLTPRKVTPVCILLFVSLSILTAAPVGLRFVRFAYCLTA